jgi:uncharacterized integral membrane protein (TIGR00698 family)
MRAAWPGIALAVTLATAAKLIVLAADRASSTQVPVSAALFAVLLGVAARIATGSCERWTPGLSWVTDKLLRIGIALIGLRLTLGGAASVGGNAVPAVLACITAALVTSIAIGRLLGLTQTYALLIAIGTAVCGCTAIIAASPVMRAREVETGIAVTCVVALGCFGMLTYPWLAHVLFADSPRAAAIFLATSIHDTSQVVGAALAYSQQFGAAEVTSVAAFTKMLRNLTMIVLIPLLGAWALRSQATNSVSGANGTPRLSRAQFLPTFLLWFVAFAVVRFVGDVLFGTGATGRHWQQLITSFGTISDWLLVCGMVAVGFSVSLPQLRAAGVRPVLCAIGVAIVVLLVSLTLTSIVA